VLDLQKYLDHYGVKFKVKEEQDRTFYLLDRCLFSENHTTKDGQGEAAIIQGRDGKLTYFCFHAHCSGKTWQDARKSISGNDSIIQFRKGYTPPVEKGNLTLDSAILDSNDFVCLEIPAKRNFIKPWLKDNHIILISGNRGVGKSWFGLSAFDHVTQKKKFGIWEAETSVPSLYIDGEMAAFDVQDRLKLLNPTIPSRQSPLYIYSDAFANGLGMPRANLLNDGWREAVKQFALSKNVKLIGFDNISSLAPGIDENVKFEWDPINQWLLNLRFLGISTILFHHTNKEGGQRGTSAREDNIDTSIILQRPPDYHAEEGAKFIVKFQKARVGLSDLSLLADIEFTLTQNGSGLIWTYGSVKRKTQVEILKMIDEGISQSEIGRILGVDRSYVSRTKTKAIKDNLLTPKGKLTQSGFSMVNSGENEDEI
jgi:putative DNA primase/helicase